MLTARLEITSDLRVAIWSTSSFSGGFGNSETSVQGLNGPEEDICNFSFGCMPSTLTAQAFLSNLLVGSFGKGFVAEICPKFSQNCAKIPKLSTQCQHYFIKCDLTHIRKENVCKSMEINGGPRHKVGDKESFHHLTTNKCSANPPLRYRPVSVPVNVIRFPSAADESFLRHNL